MGPYHTAQGTVCDWISLLYSSTLRNIVNKLYFNNNFKHFLIKKIKEKNKRKMDFYKGSINILESVGTYQMSKLGRSGL